jgi:transcriptional regulator with XRE-family HTH domain
VVETLSPSQCRMARAALEWTATDLAEKSGVGVTTISRFESGLTAPNRSTLAALQRALEDVGIEFIPENGGGVGVRLRKRAT